MSDEERLLEQIEEGVVEHGGALGGWTCRIGDRLQLFDGRVTLEAEIKETADGAAGASTSVHAHVRTTLHEHDDEQLDACLFGMGDDGDAALAQVATIWITGVAGPIKSFLDHEPICLTCQAGVQGGNVAEGFSPHDFGLAGLRAFVGPMISRGLDGEPFRSASDDAKPWFRFAAESAAPRRVHLAKATVVARGNEGWSRDLEVDGHDVSYHDPDWPAGVRGPEFGYVTRFAVFEFPRNSAEIPRRAALERTIRHFAEHYARHETIEGLERAMVDQGFDADLVHEVESISTIAFGRTYFEPYGVQYPSTVIRARRDGRIEADVPLMSLPAYTRARALAVRLRDEMPPDDFQSLCCYNAESNAILNASREVGGKLDLSQMKLYPCVVPDRGVSQSTMDAALALLHDLAERNRPKRKKPWWKFW